MHPSDLRTIFESDIIDYQQLVDALKNYKKPRDKITRLLANSDLIRIRKGLYIFGEKWRRRPIDRYLIANLIYGPSHVSFESALSHYGLIPERVESVTSATTGKRKRFITPLGLFTYQAQPRNYYTEGVVLEERSWGSFLLGTPEKALADKLLMDRSAKINDKETLERYLFEDLRIDCTQLQKMNASRLEKIARASQSSVLSLLVQYVKKISEVELN